VKRCDWCLSDELYVKYHDEEWGIPTKDSQTLFEFLLLEGAQAGLSWITVLRKRDNYREAYDGFDAEKISRYGKRKKTQLLRNEGIIRNRLKIDSAIKNAQAFLQIESSEQNFSEYIWSFVDGEPIQNHWQSLHQIPNTTPLSDRMAKDLQKRGFNFVGSTICYAFMQATGMVNDHLIDCHRYKPCQQSAS
jgi:DNA-3-methyladenine glycosylase I